MKTFLTLTLSLTLFSFAYTQPGPWEFIEVDQAPKPLNMYQVVRKIGYPTKARDRNIEGKVVARVLVDEGGNYKDHVLLEKPHVLLSQPVEEHLSLLEFSPALRGKKKVKFWVNVPFSFKMYNPLRDAKDLPKQIEGVPLPQNFQAVIDKIGYPDRALRKKIEGTVIANVLVNSKGEYVKHEITQSVHPALDKAVSKQVPNLLFDPYVKEGKAIGFWTKIPFEFKIQL